MQNSIRLSVIIPMYQSEKYISECIRSVSSQAIEEIEIICVDDGCTDNTCNIVQQKMNKDERIQLVHITHSGVSCARNAGIGCSSGAYILFLDADDKLCNKKLASTLRKAEKKKADILIFSGTTSAPYSTPLWVRDAFSAHNMLYHDFSPDIFLKEKSCRPSACNKLYRRGLIQKYGLRFPESLSLAEDHVFQFLVFPKAQDIVFTRNRLYFYRINQENSAVGNYEQKPNEKKEMHFRAMKLVYECWEQEGYFLLSEYRRVFILCYLELMFGELLEGSWEERHLTASRIYQELLPLQDTWCSASSQMEIVTLLEQRNIPVAEQKLASYQKKTWMTRVLLKMTAPARYVKRVGLYSAFEHYIGRILHTEP